MKAVVFHGDIRLDDVPEPAVRQPAEAHKESDRRRPGWMKIGLQPSLGGTT